MNNKRNRKSIFSFKSFLIIILSCLFFILCLSNIGCETIVEKDGAAADTGNTAEVEGETAEESGEIIESEDTGSGEESQEEAAAEADISEENGEENLSDSEEENQNGVDNNESITIRIYYADEMGEYLVGESRVLPYEHRYMEALVELLKVPIDDKLFPLVPETTKVYSVEIDDGNAMVNLSRDFVDDRFKSDTTDILLIYSIVNTLTEFPDIYAVTFYVEGKKIDTLGALDISGPLYRKSDLIIR